MRKLLLLLELILLSMAVKASDSGTWGENVTWAYDDDSKTLTIFGSGAMADASIGSVPWYDYRNEIQTIIVKSGVTSIGNCVFCRCFSLTSVTIPNDVTSIGGCAFYDCRDLTSVNIPNSVTFIGDGAFENCYDLTSITIPNNVTYIGDYAFEGCI